MMSNVLMRRSGFALVSVLFVALFSLALPATTMAAAQKCAAKDVTCVITFGDQRIAERQTALTNLKDKVTALQQKHHITDAESDALQGNIKAGQDGLTDLKTKLDAATDEKMAREDVKNVYSTLRIFAVVVPRDEKHLHLAIELKLRDTFEDLKPHVEGSVDKAPANNKTQASTLLADYKTNLTNAEAQIDTAQTTLKLLTVDNYNANHATFEANLKQLESAEKAINADLHKVGSDLHEINKLTKSK